uniref:2',3'-cyclic-nucleotide 3'-phosphodiesterase n=1 Tax=Asterionellopsis glacialis TaxID=33640 RepID=A0A7S0PVL2_9STRA|mmetsp:Transcript_1886/g.2747  ORF Transcript_1886/g.2747 Transcript_1886/m.2747 type:complete len:264 (+) Transcript_1886:166-957(+)
MEYGSCPPKDHLRKPNVRKPPKNSPQDFLLLPQWSPHISLAAGVTEARVAMDVAQQIASQGHSFLVDVSGGSEVDGETPETRSTIYFSWQRLRAAWIHCSVVAAGNNNNDNDDCCSVKNKHNKFGEDCLGNSCRQARNLLGDDAQTSKFIPHLSLVYFDQEELDQEQRSILRKELGDYFVGKDALHIESIWVASTEGKPGEWKVLKEFPLAGNKTNRLYYLEIVFALLCFAFLDNQKPFLELTYHQNTCVFPSKPKKTSAQTN